MAPAQDGETPGWAGRTGKRTGTSIHCNFYEWNAGVSRGAVRGGGVLIKYTEDWEGSNLGRFVGVGNI